jgi:hypothetical protein
MATYAGRRYLTSHPHVIVDNHKRMPLFHQTEQEDESFRSHRTGLAHLKLNPISTSKLFEGFLAHQKKA